MEDLLYWIWLSRVFYYGSKKVGLLIEEFKTPKAVFEAKDEQLSRCCFLSKEDCKLLRGTSLARAELIAADCEKHKIEILSYDEGRYPQRLRNLYAAPPVIYYKGNLLDIDNEASIAVVGTRKASEYGKRLTGNLCYELAKAGALIVSGCAEGIDGFAHLGALKAGKATVGVMGCGLDVDYPMKHHNLKEAMLERGMLLSECPPGELPRPQVFPLRNRIIAGISVGVLVTEAPDKSGALITAEHAIEQGKELFCVPPHDIYDANFAGVSSYLRDGAKAVLSPKDILEEYFDLFPDKLDRTMQFANTRQKRSYKSATTHPRTPKETAVDKQNRPIPKVQTLEKQWDATLSEQHRKLYDTMQEVPMHIDEIAAQSDLPIYRTMALITELELMEYITSYSGKRYAKIAVLVDHDTTVVT